MDKKGKSVKPTAFRSTKMCRDLSEIMREDALPYLPAKSLLRFRTICRDWKHQISGPFFTHSQSNSCRSALGLFYQPLGEPPSFISMDPNSCGVPNPSLSFLPVPIDIKSSSNGLLCCRAQAGDKAYYVCNPVLQQWKKLPKSNADHGSNPEVVLVFEPSLLNFEADYKVFCGFPSNDFDEATEFEIYSSKDGTWKHSAEIRFGKVGVKAGGYANGTIYWMIKYSLLAHDVATDKAKEIYGYPAYETSNIGISNGTLGTTTDGKTCLATCQGLTVILNVLSTNKGQVNNMSGYSRHRKEDVIITMDMSEFSGTSINSVIAVTSHFVVVKSRGRLYSYNMKTKEVKAMTDVVDHRIITTWLPYVNTFASLEFQ